MKYLKDYKEGDRVLDVYLCKHKQSAVTKNGKSYDNVKAAADHVREMYFKMTK